jgi:hypothetical protein
LDPAYDRSLIDRITVGKSSMIPGRTGFENRQAVRYQIMVRLMVFGSGGLGAAAYLEMQGRWPHDDPGYGQGEM